MKKLLTLSLLVAITAGCARKAELGEGVITTDFTKKIIPIQKAGIIKSFDVVKLNTPDDVIIGDINKVLVFNDRLYVADYSQTRSVYIFDMEGNLQHTISRYGRGPGEYLNVVSVFIDPYANRLNILNSFPARLLSFELSGQGDPQIIEFKDASLRDMTALEDCFVGYTTVSSKGEHDNIYMFDRAGNKLDQQIEFPQGWESNGFGDVDVFSKFDENLYFKPIYNNTIYRLDGETFEPVYSLDFGNYNWPDDVQTADQYRDSKVDFIKKIYDYQETKSHWLLSFILKGQPTLAVVDKSSGESTLCSLEPNETPYLISFGKIKNITQNHIITSVEAQSVLRTYEDEEFLRDYPESVKRLKEKIGDVRADGNSLIVIYHI